MTYTEAHRHFLTALRADPKTPAPTLCMRTIEDLHTWKSEMRAYDAARIELGIVTAQEVQERNSAVRIKPGHKPRIIFHAEAPQPHTKAKP